MKVIRSLCMSLFDGGQCEYVVEEGEGEVTFSAYKNLQMPLGLVSE